MGDQGNQPKKPDKHLMLRQKQAELALTYLGDLQGTALRLATNIVNFYPTTTARRGVQVRVAKAVAMGKQSISNKDYQNDKAGCQRAVTRAMSALHKAIDELNELPNA